MEEKKRKKLEGLLKAVQDTKSDYYVGTQEAYKAVKRISSEIYENPERSAIMVNHTLKQRFTRPSYEATPERVYGAFQILSDGVLDVIESYQDEPDETNFLYTLDYEEMMEQVGNLVEIETGFHYRMQPSDLSRILAPYFTDANERKVSNDADLGRVITDYLKENLKNHSENISPQFMADYLEWAVKFLNNLGRMNWNDRLSKESFNRNLSTYRALILIDELNLLNIVDRLINDRYDHRLEYRRQVLSHWLEDGDNYEEVVKTADFMIKSRKERYKKLRLLNAPLSIIENERRMIQSARFVRHLLGSEKNFVERCLGE